MELNNEVLLTQYQNTSNENKSSGEINVPANKFTKIKCLIAKTSLVVSSVLVAGNLAPVDHNPLGQVEVAEASEVKQGLNDFQQTKIVDAAKAELGTKRTNGYDNAPGECIVSMGRWVNSAAGKVVWNPDGGYYTSYIRSGGVEVSLGELKPGDVLQRLSGGSDYNSNTQHVHTAVFESYGTNGTVNTIDSNQLLDGTVREHTNVSISPMKYSDGSTWVWHAFRLGKVSVDINSGYSDGTFLKVNESGAIYRMVGGAPIRQFNWGAIPDFRGSATSISHADLGKLPTYPRDGSFISIAEAGGTGIYEFAGGAPIRQFNWGAIPGYNPQSVVSVNFESLAQLDHMRPKPKDGTFISIAEAGGSGIYEFAGGAPIRQFNWGAIPGFNGATPINFESLAKLDHMNQYPSDGTFISIAEAGGAGIYEFAGGAPLRLFNQGIIPGFNSVVTVNFESLAKLDHMRPNPENGKFLASRETGVVYRTAGGAALKLYNWGAIPGYGNIIWVNQRTIDQHDHLLTTPTNGTILQGVTSNSDWLINNGARSSTTNKSGAVIVDEQTIANFPVK